MPENPSENRFTTTALITAATPNGRPAEQYYINNTIENVYRNVFPVVWMASTPQVKNFATGNIFRNSSSLDAIMRMSTVQGTMTDNLFENLTDHSGYILATQDMITLFATNTTFR